MNDNHEASKINMWTSETTMLPNATMKWNIGILKMLNYTHSFESAYHRSRDISNTKGKLNISGKLQKTAQRTGHRKSPPLVRTI